MNCDVCKGPMKPLFTGHFCPNDCDRPKAQAPAPKKTGATMVPIPNTTWGPWGAIANWLPPTQNAYKPADDECRNGMCRAKGKPTHSSVVTGNPVMYFTHYQCTLCNQTWAVKDPPPKGTP